MASLLDRVRAALAPRYTIRGEAVVGGMGVVFEAYDHRLKRRVALKVLRPETATAVGLERFRREGLIQASLAHPNLITIHDVDETDGLPYFTMDFLDGETLSARLRRGPLSSR